MFSREPWAESTVIGLSLVAFASGNPFVWILPIGFYLLYKRVYHEPRSRVCDRKGGLEGEGAGPLPRRLLRRCQFLYGSGMVALMSKTKRKSVRREFEVNPLTRHERLRRCDSCGVWMAPDEISVDRNEAGVVLGWFCPDCI